MQAFLNRPDSHFHPGAQVQLFQQVLDMNLDGAIADIEFAPDHLVGEPFSNQPENVFLPGCQTVEVRSTALLRLVGTQGFGQKSGQTVADYHFSYSRLV